MKKISNSLYGLLCFSLFFFIGCKEDELEPLPETVPLVTTLNKTSFVMGDQVEVTISIDHSKDESLVANEDFTVRFTAKKSGGEEDVSSTLFDNFPTEVTFKKGETSLTTILNVKTEGISELWNVDLGIFARGYLFGKSMSTDTKTITVSDYHHTTVSVKDNIDKEIKEGETFTLIASVSTAVETPLTVTLVPKEGEEEHYENLPESLVIQPGENSVESGPITLKKDNISTGNIDLTINLSVDNAQYPLSEKELVLKLQDSDKALGEKLMDERWVYNTPDRMFMSATNEGSVVAWRPGLADLMKEGDPHPNAELGKKWFFLNAIEFHNIANSTKRTQYNTTTCKFFSANNTVLAQKDAAVDNERFTNIDNNGVIRIWGAKGQFNATSPASGKRKYGTAALYASKFWADQPNMYAVQNTRIYAGIRVEIRARCRGSLYGTNPALWLMGNTDGDVAKAWPKCGEIDILEVPTGVPGTNVAYQTFHYDGDGNGQDKSVSVKKSMGVQMQEWNIYWVEWRSNDEVAFGINGEETLVLKRENAGVDAIWPYDMTYNPWGFKLIISLGLKNSWALGNQIPNGWDSGFAGISYNESQTSDASPRMEIDWVRYYKNENYSCSDPIWKGGKTY